MAVIVPLYHRQGILQIQSSAGDRHSLRPDSPFSRT
jgi:hypothetical protein